MVSLADRVATPMLLAHRVDRCRERALHPPHLDLVRLEATSQRVDQRGCGLSCVREQDQVRHGTR
jgi:hypothetical protein